MFDLKKYIYSTALQKSNQNRSFTPLEQASIIARSDKCSLKDKIEDLEILLDSYDEKQFNDGIIWKKNGYTQKDIYLMIQTWRDVWNERLNSKNAVFGADLREKCETVYHICDFRFYSDYARALEFLNSEKESYLNSEHLKDIKTYGEIWKIVLNDDDPDCYIYYYDNQMKLIKMAWSSKKFRLKRDMREMVLPNFYVPFKAGDWIKIISPFYETQYGILEVDAQSELDKEREFLERFGVNDTDMKLPVKMYDSSSNSLSYMNHIECWDMEYCTMDEIKELLKEK